MSDLALTESELLLQQEVMEILPLRGHLLLKSLVISRQLIDISWALLSIKFGHWQLNCFSSCFFVQTTRKGLLKVVVFDSDRTSLQKELRADRHNFLGLFLSENVVLYGL